MDNIRKFPHKLNRHGSSNVERNSEIGQIIEFDFNLQVSPEFVADTLSFVWACSYFDEAFEKSDFGYVLYRVYLYEAVLKWDLSEKLILSLVKHAFETLRFAPRPDAIKLEVGILIAMREFDAISKRPDKPGLEEGVYLAMKKGGLSNPEPILNLLVNHYDKVMVEGDVLNPDAQPPAQR